MNITSAHQNDSATCAGNGVDLEVYQNEPTMREISPSDVSCHGTLRKASKASMGVRMHNELVPGEGEKKQSSRAIPIAGFAVAVVIISTIIFVLCRKHEEAEFQSQFENTGLQVLNGFQVNAARKLRALNTLSVEISSFAVLANLTWPFVTLPNSATLLEPHLEAVDAATLRISPIIMPGQRGQWEGYSVMNQGWIDKDLSKRRNSNRKLKTRKEYPFRIKIGESDKGSESYAFENFTASEPSEDGEFFTDSITPYIKTDSGFDTTAGPWVVWWQYAPVIEDRWYINYNKMSFSSFSQQLETVLKGFSCLSPTDTFERSLEARSRREYEFALSLLESSGNEAHGTEPTSSIHYPIYDTHETQLDVDERVAAVLSATVYWRTYFQDVLPVTAGRVVCVVDNDIAETFTYQVEGSNVTFLGSDDFHDSRYDGMEISEFYIPFSGEERDRFSGAQMDDSYLNYRIRVYPSQEFEDSHKSNRPITYAMIILTIFLSTTVIFLLHERSMKCQTKVAKSELRPSVGGGGGSSSILPKVARARLMARNNEGVSEGRLKTHSNRLKSYLDYNRRNTFDFNTTKDSSVNPLAEFFPEATVMVANVQEFTSYSSCRNPSQPLALLEQLYCAFDTIAQRNGICKVETRGDCYVAVCGLPDSRKDHAVLMTKFARACQIRMKGLMNELENVFGPETSELKMRFGLSSGPVTAGVIRGDNDRFQLFGETVSKAAKMEETGEAERLHVSKETADHLVRAGKVDWIQGDKQVLVKGRGYLQSYWVKVEEELKDSASLESAAQDESANTVNTAGDESNLGTVPFTEKDIRSINWVVGILFDSLIKIAAHRPQSSRRRNMPEPEQNSSAMKASEQFFEILRRGGTVIEEVQEVITLPMFPGVFPQTAGSGSVKIDPLVLPELGRYVSAIAAMYPRNSFHNFDHATHVILSISKLLTRTIQPQESPKKRSRKRVQAASAIHDHSFGISSDPLTQFAVMFSALIHDVGHPGVPNAQLILERSDLAVAYKRKSVLEQNSVDLAWRLLMEPTYSNLRECIYSNTCELRQFRQVVVNTVMATDIKDRDVLDQREARWKRAFASPELPTTPPSSREDIMNRKATVVIEHMIQASDVSHTMQHWHVYRKWNERFFLECHQAYIDGRAERDPIIDFFEGELEFFDFYVIPLAKKLKECKVFGVAGIEYLRYAQQNRQEWATKGQEVVMELKEKARLCTPSARAAVKKRGSMVTGPYSVSFRKFMTFQEQIKYEDENDAIPDDKSLPASPFRGTRPLSKRHMLKRATSAGAILSSSDHVRYIPSESGLSCSSQQEAQQSRTVFGFSDSQSVMDEQTGDSGYDSGAGDCTIADDVSNCDSSVHYFV